MAIYTHCTLHVMYARIYYHWPILCSILMHFSKSLVMSSLSRSWTQLEVFSSHSFSSRSLKVSWCSWGGGVVEEGERERDKKPFCLAVTVREIMQWHTGGQHESYRYFEEGQCEIPSSKERAHYKRNALSHILQQLLVSINATTHLSIHMYMLCITEIIHVIICT